MHFVYIIVCEMRNHAHGSSEHTRSESIDTIGSDHENASSGSSNRCKFCVYIGVATNPLLRLYSHNRRSGFPAGSRATRDMAPHWKLGAVFGPFVRGSSDYRDQLYSKFLHFRQSKVKQRYRLVMSTRGAYYRHTPNSAAPKSTEAESAAKRRGFRAHSRSIVSPISRSEKHKRVTLWIKGSPLVRATIQDICTSYYQTT